MSGRIDALDAYARTLFVRAERSGLSANLPPRVRDLHHALRRLRVHAVDPERPVSRPRTRRLAKVLEGCESALKMLEHVLDRHGAVGDVKGISDHMAAAAAADAKLAHETAAIDAFVEGAPSEGRPPSPNHSWHVISTRDLLALDGIAGYTYRNPGASSRLAPDCGGRDIPPDAQWTKMARGLVSPEALHRAGVRFEARPAYVAVLGRATREQVEQYVRLSRECRAARAVPDDRGREESSDDGGDFDGSDSEAEERVCYPAVIVSPPGETPPALTAPRSILKKKKSHEESTLVRKKRSSQGLDRARGLTEDARADKDRRRRDLGRQEQRSRDDRSQRREDHRREEDHDDGRRRDEAHRRDTRRQSDGGRAPGKKLGGDEGRRARRSRSKIWGETLGVVGIGGAAVLLGILAEAASAHD